MNLIDLLKKLKSIEADPEYVKNSRRVILSTQIKLEALSPWRFILNSLEVGSSIVLAGLLIILLIGGFSTSKFLTPLTLSSLDIENLEAEADAIDIQIQLNNFQYSEELNQLPIASPNAESTRKQAPTATDPKSASSSMPESIAIEEALEKLISE